MRRVIWLILAVTMTAGLGAVVGCSDDKPNPALTVPDIKPAGRDKGKEPSANPPRKR